MKEHPIKVLLKKRDAGQKVGIYSACTAHPLALEAVIEAARDTDTYALIEATANQVDQFGGYTGMTPQQFADFVKGIAQKAGLPAERLILGGDHLGPLVWHDLPEAEAMANAADLIRAYVQAGFTKIHLDTSMRLGDDDPDAPLSDETIARRAAQLAAVAEKTGAKPVYVIGSEVPIPGGAHDNEETVSITTPEHFVQTYEAFKDAFSACGLDDAFDRIVAVVVQPGVEFSDATISDYDREKARPLTAELDNYPGVVFEGHSTDYQMPGRLRQMVEDGVAILKVGPALTFALREALFALNGIEEEVLSQSPRREMAPSKLKEVLLDTMWADPTSWKDHYHSTDAKELEHQMLYSLSDRCRYYLPYPSVREAQDRLIENLDTIGIPDDVLQKHLPTQYRRVKEGTLPLTARAIIKDHIKDRIADYLFAIGSQNLNG